MEGGKEDVDGVINWCSKGADSGYSQSERNLGILYAKGAKEPDGTQLAKPDNERAYFWLYRGRKDAFRDAVANNLIPEKRAEIEKNSKDWKPSKDAPPVPPGLTPPKP